MKKVIIKRLDGTERAGAKYENELEMQSWIDECVLKNKWGKKAGFYPLSQLSELELAQEISRISENEMGPILDPMIEIPDQYTIEILDVTEEHEFSNAVKKAYKDQEKGKLILATLHAINSKKFSKGELSQDAFLAMLDNPELRYIERLLLNGSLETAKYFINQLDETFFSKNERQKIKEML